MQTLSRHAFVVTLATTAIFVPLCHHPGQKLFWSTSIVMSTIIWVLSIFWAAVPLMGWGVYDFEPMRTCCTLDYTRGDR